MKYLTWFILLLTVIFNLWLNYPETQILADPNDNIFQFSLVGRTNWIWENYGCPISLDCLPNLLDHNVPNWAEGYPLPFYYSHIPQVAIVSSYHLLIKPISQISPIGPITLYQYYNWTKYLLLTFFPLSVFFALRIVGFSPILAAFGAFFSMNLSTDGLYGIDPPSYLWRGYGLTSQLYAIVFLPLAIAFVFRTLNEVRNGNNLPSHFSLLTSNVFLAILFLTLTTAGHLGIGIIGMFSAIPFLFLDLNLNNIFARTKKLFLVLSSSFIVLSYWLIPILFANQYHIISFWDPIWKFNSYGWYEVIKQFFNGEIFDWQRFPIITILTTIGFFVMLSNSPNSPSPNASPPPLKVRGGKGELWNTHSFPLLFAFWFLLYFGRTTWGGLIDLIPGMKDFHQSRFVVGVHVAALFLIPTGLEWLFSFISNIKDKMSADEARFLSVISSLFSVFGLRLVGSSVYQTDKLITVKHLSDNRQLKTDNRILQDAQIRINTNITFYILIFIFISLLIYFTAKQTVAYATLNNKWIYQANDAYRYDEQNFKNMLSQINASSGRIYAGRPGNWGKDFRLGSTQLYLLLGGIGYDISQFLPETWSPLSENEQNFDEREALDYDLLNIRYVVSEKNHDFAKTVNLYNKYGPFELYQAETSGWFDVVTSPMFVKSDKTNYINLVHLWWNSYARRWKMNPLISVDKNPTIPAGMQRIITMTDEVSYTEGGNSPQPPLKVRGGEGGVKNIFSDFPFVFPEATISAYLKESPKDTWKVAEGLLPGGGTGTNTAIISSEKVEKQTYSATIEAPNKCKQCFAMFKMSYHPDWQVKVDGQPAPKFAVFPFYLATPVTPGPHTVEFTYQPNRLKVILLSVEIILLFLLIGKNLSGKFTQESGKTTIKNPY